MTKVNKRTFHVYAKVLIDTSIEISARSLDDALEQSKSLKVDDYIEVHGEHCDSDMKITGVYEMYTPVQL